MLPLNTAVAFSPDRKTLATASFNSKIRLWDWRTGRQIRLLEGHASGVSSIAFSRDGRHLTSASFDSTVRVWEVFSGLLLKVWEQHRGPALSVAMLPKGRAVVSASSDTSVLLWDITERSEKSSLPPRQLTVAEFERLWNDLASLNTDVAYNAVWTLLQGIDGALPLAEKRVALIDPKDIKKLLKDLNHPKFIVRDKATRKLASYGQWIVASLKQAMTNAPSQEVRQRLIQLQQKLDSALPVRQERLRMSRLMLVLEQDGSDRSRKILQSLARLAPEEVFQQEATMSLLRIKNRQGD